MSEKKNEWIIKLDQEVKNLADVSRESVHWNKRSIYRVPTSIADQNKAAYKPQVVSLGPYYYGDRHLEAMQEHKHRALLHFLKRSGKTVGIYSKALEKVAQSLKEAYDQLDVHWVENTEEFLQLMLLDGCFVLEILRCHNQNLSDHASNEILRCYNQNLSDYASNDPIFSKHGTLYMMPYIRRDMLMLENQLPMLLLDTLVETEGATREGNSVNKLILKFYSANVPDEANMGRYLHILDAFRKSLLYGDATTDGASSAPKDNAQGHQIIQSATELHEAGIKIEVPQNGNMGKCLDILDAFRKSLLYGASSASKHNAEGYDIIRSATELHEAGIIFKKSRTQSLKDISFHRGVLRLPMVVVDDTLESMFLNMIAFERYHVGAGNEVTSYIFFMDNIIDSAADVSLLHAHGIIQNALGSDKAVAKLFNSMSKDITLDPESFLDGVHKKVSDYCKKPWNEWRANLIHTYFRNPWAILSVLAAILLFALTIIQTIYSVLSFYNDSGSS